MVRLAETEGTAVLQQAEWIVDALLGTGTRGTVREPFVEAIEQINQSPARVLAVDLPSGLDCNTGEPLGACVKADHTATYLANKVGFSKPAAAPFVGTVHVLDIGLPPELLLSES